MDPILSSTTLLKAAGTAASMFSKYKKADSLISYTKDARVEPICIIDKRATIVPFLMDTLQSINSQFAAYYLQAVSISCTVGDIHPGKLLNHLNPERPFSLESYRDNGAVATLIGSSGPSQGFSLYARTAGLEAMTPQEAHNINGVRVTPSMEASFQQFSDRLDDAAQKVAAGAAKVSADFISGAAVGRSTSPFTAGGAPLHGKDGKPVLDESGNPVNGPAPNANVDYSYDLGKSISEAANLAVGRVYNVNLQSGKSSATIPVMIRLVTVEASSETVVNIMAAGARTHNSSFKERLFQFKLKSLKFWRDLVMCQDLIDEHRKALINDHTGIYAEIRRRRASNAAAGAASLKPSVGTASNIVVMTRDTVRELEKRIGGKFSVPSVRDKVFQESMLMIVAVLDPDHDHVTFYFRGIALPTEVTVAGMKAANKGTGPDVGSILKSLMNGAAPSF